MEISEGLFTEITGVIPTAPAEEVGNDRRRHTRVVFGLRGKILPLFGNADGEGLPALVRDISRSGIGLLFSEELSIGDEFVIQLPRLSGSDIQIQCMVKRCEAGGTGGGNFVVGAAFELVLDEMLPMLSTPLPPLHRPRPEISLEAKETGAPADRRDPWLLAFFKGFATATRINRSGARIRRRLRASRPIDWEKKFQHHWQDPAAVAAAKNRPAPRPVKPLTPAEAKAAADFWA